MIVFLHIPRFYVDGRAPSIVVRDRRVLDACYEAESLGVTLGMPVATAKAVLAKQNLGIQVRQWKPEEYESKQREWLDVCCQFTDVIEPVDQHEAFLDLSSHPSSFELFSALKSKLGDPATGIARVKWLARAALCSGDPENLAYFAPNAFLDELPTSHLEPVQPESRARLEFLGYRTAGDVLTIPLEVLRDQFGREALTIWQACRGAAGAQVLPIYPEFAVSARFYFDSPVNTRDPIEAALQVIARRLAKKLSTKDLQGSIIRLWMGFEDEPELLVQREFAKPMQSTASLRMAASMLCQPKKPLVSIRVQMPQLRKANRKQQSLYVARTDSENVVRGAVGQVQKVFGSDAIKLGSEMKLPRRQLVLRAWKDATGWA
jgi:DNA polymerase IV